MSSSRPTAIRSLVTAITEDIYQVRIPLPFRLNHIQSYLLHSPQGWTIVDFGLNWPDAQDAWQTAFAELNIGPNDVQQLILTHMHPDHFGMAGWFQEWCGCPIQASALTADQIRRVWTDNAWDPEKVYTWWDQCGIPQEMSRSAASRAVSLRKNTFPHPQTLELIEPDSTLKLGERTFQTIHAPGHAEGQILFYDADDKIMLSGDQVLMKITPNIGKWPTSSQDPLDNYLRSLDSLKQFNVRLALPGHMALITEWQGRLQEIIDHHAARLEQTLNALESPITVYDVGLSLFPLQDLSPHEVRFAVAETLAHVEYLVGLGKVARMEGLPDLYVRV